MNVEDTLVMGPLSLSPALKKIIRGRGETLGKMVLYSMPTNFSFLNLNSLNSICNYKNVLHVLKTPSIFTCFTIFRAVKSESFVLFLSFRRKQRTSPLNISFPLNFTPFPVFFFTPKPHHLPSPLPLGIRHLPTEKTSLM